MLTDAEKQAARRATWFSAETWGRFGKTRTML